MKTSQRGMFRGYMDESCFVKRSLKRCIYYLDFEGDILFEE